MNRKDLWEQVDRKVWDIVIIGGGITGAGIFYESVRRGWDVLLLEARDFAWGASSRSGKLLHGGLRYLRQKQFRLVWQSVREREALLKKLPGLAGVLPFAFPVYRWRDRWWMGVGLWIYDWMAGKRTHRFLSPSSVHWLFPHLKDHRLRGGYIYREGVTDDARLVFRLIQDGVLRGGCALNYAPVVDILLNHEGRVRGVVARDQVSGEEKEIQSRVVVHATGPWVDRLRKRLGKAPRMRPLRGAHLLFPFWRFPLSQGIGFFHPVDGRPLYALPWMGGTLVGTTDVDHTQDLDEPPYPSEEEIDYLFQALNHYFPSLELGRQDLLATFAGVRPVIRHGASDPSREPRDHAIWDEGGMITVTGGKLTTFRFLARDTLKKVMEYVRPRKEDTGLPAFSVPSREAPADLTPEQWIWLAGRYGERVFDVLAFSRELEPIEPTPHTWAEVWWALHKEMVVHLEDLLLRRTRMGWFLPENAPFYRRLRDHLIEKEGWTPDRWEKEFHQFLRVRQVPVR